MDESEGGGVEEILQPADPDFEAVGFQRDGVAELRGRGHGGVSL